MNARYYLPSVGRFISADTIVPNPTNPQAYNRYSYVNNNPINYVDPSGHCGADVGNNPGETEDLYAQCEDVRSQIETTYGISIEGKWKLWEMQALWDAIARFLTWYGQPLNRDGFWNTFGADLDTIEMIRPGDSVYDGYGNLDASLVAGGGSFYEWWFNVGAYNKITLNQTALYNYQELRHVILHEMMHAFLKNREYIIDDWEENQGWEWGANCVAGLFCENRWAQIPASATSYALLVATGQTSLTNCNNCGNASEEDLAQHFAHILNVDIATDNLAGWPLQSTYEFIMNIPGNYPP